MPIQTFRNQSETGLVIIPAHPSARLSWKISCTCIFRHAAVRSRNALCDPNKRFPWRLPSAHQDPAAAPSLYSLSRPTSFNPTRTRCATASSRIPGPSTTQPGGLPIISRPRIRRPGTVTVGLLNRLVPARARSFFGLDRDGPRSAGRPRTRSSASEPRDSG